MTMKGSKDLDLVDQSSEASASYQEEMDDVDEETTTIGASKNGVVNRTHSDNVREIEGWFHKETKRVRLSRSLFMLSVRVPIANTVIDNYAFPISMTRLILFSRSLFLSLLQFSCCQRLLLSSPFPMLRTTTPIAKPSIFR